jgi:hypothetical protein
MWGFDCVWQFGLYPMDEKRTRLVSPGHVRPQSAWAQAVECAHARAGGIFMTRRMLLGLKQRAEALGAANIGETRASQRPAA